MPATTRAVDLSPAHRCLIMEKAVLLPDSLTARAGVAAVLG